MEQNAQGEIMETTRLRRIKVERDVEDYLTRKKIEDKIFYEALIYELKPLIIVFILLAHCLMLYINFEGGVIITLIICLVIIIIDNNEWLKKRKNR
jgi:hypothetical protein